RGRELTAALAAVRLAEDWRLRHVLGRAAGVSRRLQGEGLRRGHRVLGWPRGHVQGRADAEPAGGAHRVHQRSLGADPRALRQRGQVADAGAGEPARGGAEEARQELRVPPLRRRRPRLLLLRPGGVPAGASRLRLEKALRLHRPDPALGERREPSEMCTMIAQQVKIMGRGKSGPEWFDVREANVSYDHPYDLPLEHALNIDFVNESMGP